MPPPLRFLTSAYITCRMWWTGKWEQAWLARQHGPGRCIAYPMDDKSGFDIT